MIPWLWVLGAAALAVGYELVHRQRPAVIDKRRRGRRWAWFGAMMLSTLIGAPPFAELARHRIWAETLQFAVIAFGVAPLVAIAAPVDLLRPRIRPPRPGDDRARGWRAWLPALGGFLVVTIGWRIPAGVDAAASGPDWLAIEVVTLVAGTWSLWATLIGSPTHPALDDRRGRVALGAVATWSVWVFAWIVGSSAHSFYPAFAGSPGAVGSQEIAVGVLWAVSAFSLGPMIFTNLIGWLNADLRDAEEEMRLHRQGSGV